MTLDKHIAFDKHIAVIGVLSLGALVLVQSCKCRPHAPVMPASTDGSADTAAGTVLLVTNKTRAEATVYFTFGSDSVVVPATWSSFCTPVSGLTCTFQLAAEKTRILPATGAYLNATVTFDNPATCGVTKIEVNLNNPSWYDTADISLVDGFSKFVYVEANGTLLGPTRGKDQNERVFGVFPFGCDVCTARQNPPCGIPKGTAGCKTGSQYKPDVPCQYQGPTKGGGGKVEIVLLQPEPA